MPGFIVDAPNPNSVTGMEFTGFDGRYAIANTLLYKGAPSVQSHVALRDMIEYFDSSYESKFSTQTHPLFPIPKEIIELIENRHKINK